MRYPVLFPNGKTYNIGGIPLCSEEKFKKIAPDLCDAREKDLTNTDAIENLVFQIVKFFHPDADKDTFLVDHYTLKEVMDIWSGQILDEDKKKVASTKSEDITEHS